MQALTIRNVLIKASIFSVVLFGILISYNMVSVATELSEGPVRLDNFTGEALEQNEVTKTDIRISSECDFNTATEQYVITMDDYPEVSVKSSVADGMITNNSVSVETDAIKEYSLYKDGEEMDNVDFSRINEIGNYVLLYKGKKVLEFKIVGEYSTIEFFYVPKGFYIKEVLIDGEPAQYDYDLVTMTEEGTYEVSYVCEATNRTYYFETTIDRTAPVLELEELDKKNRAKGPVDLSDREAHSRVKVVLDGQELEEQNTLTKSGKYTVTIFDRAGNYSTYNFTIMIYFNLSSTVFILLILAVAIGIAVYIGVSAKLLKVY